MSADDYKIISNTRLDLPGYSDTKVKKMASLKSRITGNNPYKS